MAPGDSEDIYAFDSGMRRARRVTQGQLSFANSFPAWSPDGEHIALVRQSEVDVLFVLHADRGTLRRVATPDLPVLGPPAWSPDGRTILISAGADAEGRRLYEVSVDSAAFAELPLLPGMIDCGSYSPDGRKLVATRTTPEQSQIVIFDLQSAVTEILFAGDSVFYHCPEWSPTGGSIGVTVYSRDYSQAKLALLDLAGNIESVAAGAAYNNAFKWSPDGSWIAYQCTEFSGTPDDPEFYRSMEICIVRPDGSGRRRLTRNSYFDAHPSW